MQGGVALTGQRSTPDVAFDADRAPVVAVYMINPSTGRPGDEAIAGGTSLGAPAWAGIIAIVNQGRTVGRGAWTAPPRLSPRYHLPSSDFHKVTSPTATGLGTPNGATHSATWHWETSKSGVRSSIARR